jgi:AcrR family transcriptional regulator
VAKRTGLRERKKAQTRRRIIEVTLELIHERGYEKTTVDEIARRVMISPPTFYSYFASRDVVLQTVANGILENWLVAGDLALEDDAPVEEHLRRFGRTVADWSTGNPELWRALVVSNALDPVSLLDQLEADVGSREGLDVIIDLFLRGARPRNDELVAKS